MAGKKGKVGYGAGGMSKLIKVFLIFAFAGFLFIKSCSFYSNHVDSQRKQNVPEIIDVDFGGEKTLRLDRRYVWLPMTHVGQSVWDAESFRNDRSGPVCAASFIFRHTDMSFKDVNDDAIMASYIRSSNAAFGNVPRNMMNSDWVNIYLARGCVTERLGLRNEPPFFASQKAVREIIRKCGYRYYNKIYKAGCRDPHGAKSGDIYFYDAGNLADGMIFCDPDSYRVPMCKIMFIDESVGLGVVFVTYFDANLLERSRHIKYRSLRFIINHAVEK